MKSEIIGLTDWLKTPPGAYLLAWEQARFDLAVGDVFGYHALQLGLPELDALQANRMPHKWVALSSMADQPNASASQTFPLHGRDAGPISSSGIDLAADSAALPFPESSLDLVVLPHTLELGIDPHSALREVERVLVPEGRVVISGLNPASLWGLRRRRDHFYRRFGQGEFFLPDTGAFIGYWRLRDWLRLLNFEVESAGFGCYRPALTSQKWLERFDWMDTAGERWWPIFGAVYFLVAVKRVRGMRLLEPAWKAHKSPAAAPAAIANKEPATKSITKS
ncbi:MAG: Methyltransferase type 11 [Polaromonas sp.]|nr:Methyltransferase type 11 [Polaromonas sp.]